MQDFRVETFLTVCRTMNYTRAAEALNITQPAVSQHIAFLEKAYGARLFDYHGKRLALTEAGELVRTALSTMAHDERLLRERVAAATSGARIDLSVGMTLTAGEYLVAAPLADYMTKRPDIHATVRSGGTRELLALLEAGEIDCAFIEGMFDRSAYEWDVYRRERLVCVCSADHRLASGRHRVEDLLSEHLLIREPGSGTRAVLEHALAARNLSLEGFRQTSMVESLDIIKVFAARGLGIAFLYEAAVARELEAGVLRLVPLEDFRVEHDISFIRLKDSVFEPEFQRLFAEVRRSSAASTRP